MIVYIKVREDTFDNISDKRRYLFVITDKGKDLEESTSSEYFKRFSKLKSGYIKVLLIFNMLRDVYHHEFD